jgi:hypothetical protein
MPKAILSLAFRVVLAVAAREAIANAIGALGAVIAFDTLTEPRTDPTDLRLGAFAAALTVSALPILLVTHAGIARRRFALAAVLLTDLTMLELCLTARAPG